MRFRVLLLVLVISACAAFAANMPVTNPSFENSTGISLQPCPSGGACLIGVGAPGWNHTGTAGILQPGVPDLLFNSIPDGQNVAYTDAGILINGLLSQTIVATAIPGVTYTLKVDLGWAKDQPTFPSQFARLVVGTVSSVNASGVDPTQGNWSEFTATFDAGVVDNGLPIRIDLGITGGTVGTQAVFDNVILSNNLSTIIPEPTSLILLGSGLGLVPALRRRFIR